MVADFLHHLFQDKKRTLSTIKGYRSALSQIMSARGIDATHDTDLRALVKSFSVERPISANPVPKWDIMVVLRFLMKPPFEPMNLSELGPLTKKTAFLLALASAKRTSELWAFAADVAYGPRYESATLRFLPGFIAKTQVPGRPETYYAPVTIPALAPSMGHDLPDRLLCPIRALRFYMDRTKVGADRDRVKRLFISYKPGHTKDLAKGTVSHWIKSTIRAAYEAVKDDDLPHLAYRNFQAREVRAIATSLAFHQNFSLDQVMKAASWRADGTFASFYLRDLVPSGELGSLVAGQALVGQPLANP